MVVVVAAALTAWGTPAELLPPKLASPAYVAVSVLAPAVNGVSVQLPTATVPVQVAAPSLTVTFPVGVPPPDVTVKVTVTPCPTTEGSGVSAVIVVVVLAAPPVCVTPADVLPAKLPSPA